MTAPTLLAQLSDPHVEVGRGDSDSAKALAAAVSAVLGLRPRPDAVIVSGDLVNDPGPREYERVRELLAPLSMPLFVIGGNHDDRDALRELFAGGLDNGANGEPFQWSARIGALRLVGCDSTIPRREEGEFGIERRAWLEGELSREPETPTIVAIHHPPVAIGIDVLDEIGLPAPDRVAFGDTLALNPQVRRVICGHVHRASFATRGGCGVFTCASTHLQARLEIPCAELMLYPDPPSFGLHALLDGEVATHVQPIAR